MKEEVTRIVQAAVAERTAELEAALADVQLLRAMLMAELAEGREPSKEKPPTNESKSTRTPSVPTTDPSSPANEMADGGADVSESPKFHCTLCNKCFPSADSVHEHIRKDHRKPPAASVTIQPTVEEEQIEIEIFEARTFLHAQVKEQQPQRRSSSAPPSCCGDCELPSFSYPKRLSDSTNFSDADSFATTACSEESGRSPVSSPPSPAHTRRGGRNKKSPASPVNHQPGLPKLSNLLHNARQMKLEEVEEMAPLDDHGNPTSLGSMRHAYGKCKVCVAFAQGGQEGCKKGARCRYCHIPHASESQPDTTSKTDRGVCRRFLNNVRNKIKKNPDLVVDQIELPKNLAELPYPRAKFVRMMEKFRQEVLSERTGSGDVASGSTSGAEPELHAQ